MMFTNAHIGCKLTNIDISGTGLTLEGAPLLLEQLCKFSALKRLNISGNPALRLLPVGMLQFATRLDTFACDGFSQNLFSTPEENPVRIRHLFQSVSLETPWEVNLAAAELTPAPAAVQEVANLFRLLPILDCLDLSANDKLGSWGVCDFLNSLTGTLLDLHLLCMCINFPRSPGIFVAVPQSVTNVSSK
jgi:hypothetical protein